MRPHDGRADADDGGSAGGDGPGPARDDDHRSDVSAPGDDAPTPPATLTTGTAVASTEAAEEHHRGVAILRAAVLDVTEVSVTCTAVEVAETGDGYEVVVACGFSSEFQDGDVVGVADGVPYEATYVVDETSIGRVGEEPALG